MPHRKRKTRKLRGHRTMGWGQVGQHRKSGMKGGRGKAGLATHKASYMLKYMPDHFGKHGFKSLKKPLKAINVGELESLVKERFGEAPEEIPSIDLGVEGYEKLLGKGELSIPVKVLVDKASQKAVEKVEAVGGEVIVRKAS